MGSFNIPNKQKNTLGVLGLMMNDNRTGIEYERLLLGCYLSGYSINAAVSPAVFQSEPHGIIFAAIRDLLAKGASPDIRKLASELARQGKIEAAGGYDRIAELTDGAYASSAAFYETEVLQEYRRRSAWRTAVELCDALKNGQAPDEMIAGAVKKLSGITAAEPHAERGMLFSDLLKKQFPPDAWHVENLIGNGLTVLSGASKIGKSWTALQLVAALDQGGYFMGSLKAEKADCFYLALEDTPKRIQRRLKKQGITAGFNGSRLETSRCTVSALRSYLKANPQFRVVVIDTLQKMLGINDLNDYSQTVDGLSALKAIADDLDIAVIAIHHNRKGGNDDIDHMESALGSTGINATADCTLTMRRKRGTGEATLSVTGRDIEDASYSLSWDRELCTWAVSGQGALKPSLPEAQRQIIGLLESEERNGTTGEIAEAIEKTKQAANNILSRMKEGRLIENPNRGQWRLKSEYTSTHSLREGVQRVLENSSEPLPEIW
jgi:DNA-binding transcriptional ArsR family regulator